MRSLRIGWALHVVIASAIVGCGGGGGGGATDGQAEIAQAAGDAMSSLDEMGRGASFAVWMPGPRHRNLFEPSWRDRLVDWVIPQAHAATCSSLAVTGCIAGVRTFDFNACTLGSATLNGTVQLTFSNTGTCSLFLDGESVTRTGDLTVGTAGGVNVHISTLGGGQRVTRAVAGFTYRVLGMRRTAVDASSTTLFDVSTRTTSDISVTGSTRATRVVDGGTLEVTNSLKQYTVTLTPDHVAWSSSCNCPVSGTLSGDVSGTVIATATLTFTGCGTANLSWKGTSASVSLDSCSTL